MADTESNELERKARTLRTAWRNSIAGQVIIVVLSFVIMHPTPFRIALVALAVYWSGVILRVYAFRDNKTPTALDLHLLHWGYFWAYCAVWVFGGLLGRLG
jgi:hypothetical protein